MLSCYKDCLPSWTRHNVLPGASAAAMFTGSATINVGLSAFKDSLRNGDHFAYSIQIHVSIRHGDFGGIYNSSMIPWTSRL
jgi:hypothetical protein